jgi:uncharacterized protein YjbJ (UPF0337 family)
MNDKIAAIAGKYEDLAGRLQEKYGIAKKERTQTPCVGQWGAQ